MKFDKMAILAHLSILTSSILLGAFPPVGKAVLAVIHPFSLSICRTGGACLLFWLVSFFMEREKVPVKDVFQIAIAALFCIIFNQTVFSYGLSLTSPIHGGIIAGTAPVLTMIVATIYFRESVTIGKVISAALGTIGVVILVLGGSSRLGHQEGNLLGDILCMLAQLSYAIYLIGFIRLITRYKAVTVSKYLFLFAFIYSAIIGHRFFLDDIAHGALEALSGFVGLQLLYIIVCCSFLPYFCIMYAQRTLHPATISSYNYVMPVVATALSVYWGMATLSFTTVAAILFIFSAVYIASHLKLKKKQKSS